MRDAAYLAKLLCEKLDCVDPGFGIEVVALDAEIVAPLQAPQSQLMATQDPAECLASAVDILVNRLGAERISRVAPYASHVPECAVQRVPPLPLKQPSWWMIRQHRGLYGCCGGPRRSR